jgi:hypothetical protein
MAYQMTLVGSLLDHVVGAFEVKIHVPRKVKTPFVVLTMLNIRKV